MTPLVLTLETSQLMDEVFDWCHRHQVYEYTAEEILTQTLRDILSDEVSSSWTVLYPKIKRRLKCQLAGFGLTIGRIDRFWFRRGVLIVQLYPGIDFGDGYVLGGMS